jgi:inhibitor of KinA sporulation pathway (predicted exonuclease)
MDLVIVTESPAEEVTRSVTLTNDQWLILSQCVEAFSDTYRKQHSQTIATYVTRGQLDQAQVEARKMNELLQQLDKLQARLV